MRIRTLIICLSIILIISVSLNIFLLVKTDKPSLHLQISKPLSFDKNGNITSEYAIVHTDRESLDIILLSLINAQPIPEAEHPTTLPDGKITVRYGGTGYPYKLWFYEDHIIFGNENGVYRKIQNDHNNPVRILQDLVDSISTTTPG